MGKFAKWTLALLTINSVAAMLFMTGAIDVSKIPGLYLTFPLAAILYGMFVIFRVFEKDAAEFDAEYRAHHDHAVLDIHPHNVKPLHDEPHKSIAA